MSRAGRFERRSLGIPRQTKIASGERFAGRKNGDPLYLDDLQVGQRFTSKTHVVDVAQIKAFARQFDPQPFHLDDDAAKDSLFSGLVASGWYTCTDECPLSGVKRT
jgi:acyl dehydratase